MAHDLAELTRHFYAEMDRRHAVPEELITDDYRIIIGTDEPRDLAAHNDYAGPYFAAFPDLDEKVVDTIVEGDKIAVRLHVTGTHRGPLLGQAPTGRSFAISALSTLVFEDGKVAELRNIFDAPALFEQLDLKPTA